MLRQIYNDYFLYKFKSFGGIFVFNIHISLFKIHFEL